MVAATSDVRPRPATAAAPAPAPPRSPRVLLVAIAACLLYAAFANGATDLPAGTWVQLALAVVATGACAAWLYGNGLALRASPLGWTALALLAGFAVWTAASIGWSVAPDRSWDELNRTIAYALVVFCGLVLGSSLTRAPEHVARTLAVVSLPVALYALGGKTLPGVHVGSLIDLDQTAVYNRLRAPLGYWNALALVCVTGLLPMLRLAVDPRRRPWQRVAALLGVLVLALVVGMTYSRGGLLALAVGLVVLVALSRERVRTVVWFASALAASALPLGIALSRTDLTTDLVPLARREDDALLVLAALIVAALGLALWGRALIALESRGFTPQRGRAVGRPLALAAGVLLAVALLGFLASGKAADAFRSFKSADHVAGVTDPNRLLSGNSGNRWTWWEEAAGAWSAKPLAGWGAGSFPVTHRLYRRQLLSVQQPHSVPLQWLAETGLVGLLLAGGAVLALLAAALAGVRRSPGPSARGASAALLAVGAAWAAHALYDWDWDIPAVTLPALFALAVLAALPDGPVRAVAARGPALAAAVVAIVLVAVSAALPAIARSKTASALETAGADHPSPAQLTAAAAAAQLASKLDPLSVEPLFAAATIEERRGSLDGARVWLVDAVRRQPDSVDGWVRLARVDFARLDRAAVRRDTLRALRADPLNPATIALAKRAQTNSALPAESPSATGSPLATQVNAP